MSEDEELISEFWERSQERQETVCNLGGKVLVILNFDEVAANLKAWQSGVFLLCDDLVEDSFEDDEKTDDKDRDDLKEQSPLIFL